MNIHNVNQRQEGSWWGKAQHEHQGSDMVMHNQTFNEFLQTAAYITVKLSYQPFKSTEAFPLLQEGGKKKIPL